MSQSTSRPFVYLRDQEPLSPIAFQRAQDCRDWARSLVENRAAFIAASGLDPEIHLPHGNWELGGGLYGAYRVVRDGGYDVCNNLRLFSEIFSGYQLTSMSLGQGKPLSESLPPNLDEKLAEWAKRQDSYVDAYRSITSDLTRDMHISPPPAFGEVGWLVNGKIVNHDTVVYLERLVLLAESGQLGALRAKPQPRVLEIGGGFGGLAYHFKRLVPQARYTIVDIPESLIFSSTYLTRLFPDQDHALITPNNLADLKKTGPGFTFVPNYLFDQCRAARLPLDLAINTLSMSEMTEKQVRYYCEGLKALLGQRGAFFEQNQDNRRFGLLDAKSCVGEHFPYRLSLASPSVHPSQGAAHLWTTTPYRPSTGNWRWRKLPHPLAPVSGALKETVRLLRGGFKRLAKLGKAS